MYLGSIINFLLDEAVGTRRKVLKEIKSVGALNFTQSGERIYPLYSNAANYKHTNAKSKRHENKKFYDS